MNHFAVVYKNAEVC